MSRTGIAGTNFSGLGRGRVAASCIDRIGSAVPAILVLDTESMIFELGTVSEML
jgi:hypothetical protein